MKPKATVNAAAFYSALNGVRLTGREMLDVAGAGARVIANKQRVLVPVQTAATQNSVGSHIDEATDERVVDDIGPETTYAPNIEYGRADMPNYPIQPFVRPSVNGNEGNIQSAISAAFGALLKAKWPK